MNEKGELTLNWNTTLNSGHSCAQSQELTISKAFVFFHNIFISFKLGWKGGGEEEYWILK